MRSRELGSYTVSIPPGSFRSTHRGGFVFAGSIGGSFLRAGLTPRGGGAYTFRFQGFRVPLTGITDPVSVGLTIGADSGTASAELDRHDRRKGLEER